MNSNGSIYVRQPSTLERILLSSGCAVYPQCGKKRVPGSLPLNLKENGYFELENETWDSSGVDLFSLPEECVILDVDSDFLLEPLLMYLDKERELGNDYSLLIVQTLRGFHIYGHFSFLSSQKGAKYLRCGVPCELFYRKRGHLTVFSPGRELVYPRNLPENFLLTDLSDLPSFLEPVKVAGTPQQVLTSLIYEGERWNTLKSLIESFVQIDEVTLSFLGNELCVPPLEEEKLVSLKQFLHAPADIDESGSKKQQRSYESMVASEFIQKNSHRYIIDNATGLWFKWKEPGYFQVFVSKQEVLLGISEFVEKSRRWSQKKETTTYNFYNRVFDHVSLKFTGHKHKKYYTPLMADGSYLIVENGTITQHKVTENMWFSYYHPFAYDPEARLSRVTADFLTHLSDSNVLKINLIRSWVRSVLLGVFSEEVALCLEGVGGSGKTVFAKFLSNLFQTDVQDASQEGLDVTGQNVVAEMDLSRITGRFETAKMLGARFVIFSDVGLRRGLNREQGSLLKRAISHESIPMEWKNSKLIQIVVAAFYMFHSNFRWVDDEMSSGLNRRLLWFDVGKAVKVQDPQLLEKLMSNAPGFFNWCLYTPESIQRLASSVEAINRDSGSMREDLMTMWVVENFFPKEDSSILVGASKNRPDGAYKSYLEYCETSGDEPCACNVFIYRI